MTQTAMILEEKMSSFSR